MSILDRAKVVVDLSEGEFLRVGFAGDKSPRAVFPSIVGFDKSPIKAGAVVDWDRFGTMLKAALEKTLRVSPHDHALLVLEAPVPTKTNRDKLAAKVFNDLRVPAFHVANGAVAALGVSKRTTGLVVLLTEGGVYATPVVNGKPNAKATRRAPYGGREVSAKLASLLKERGKGAPAGTSLDYMRDHLGYVAMDYDEEMAKAETSSDIEQNYELPDGQVITIGAERFRCSEVLFKPSFIGLEQEGVHKLSLSAVKASSAKHRKELYGNVVMSGGTTMFAGISDRMTKELKALAPDSMTIKIIAPPERRYSVWIGGSILSSLSTFEEMWITKDEYDEAGPSIVHRKCT